MKLAFSARISAARSSSHSPRSLSSSESFSLIFRLYLERRRILCGNCVLPRSGFETRQWFLGLWWDQCRKCLPKDFIRTSVSDPDPVGSISLARIRFRKRWSGSGYQKKIVINSHPNPESRTGSGSINPEADPRIRIRIKMIRIRNTDKNTRK